MITWKLRDYLDRHNVSAYALAKRADTSPTTIYALARGDHERVSLEVLDKVIDALEHLTGEQVSVSDLLERTAPPPRDSDLTEAGLSDYVSDLEALEQDIDPADLAAWNAAFERA